MSDLPEPVQITILRDGAPAETRRFSKVLIKIGSSLLCDLRLADPAVSSTHARLIVSSGSVMIEDQRSRVTCPETLVNGVSIFGAPRRLASGSIVSIGPVRLRVAFGSELTSAAEPPLALPPRSVPFPMVFAELFASRSSAWYFGLFVVLVGSTTLWDTIQDSWPWLLPPVALALLVAMVVKRIVGARKRIGLLRWGKVAKVLAVQSNWTGWASVTYPVARGWRVDRAVNGDGYHNVVKYMAETEAKVESEPERDYRTAASRPQEAAPYQGVIVVKGLEYQGGVILYDARNPAVALCVDAFASDLDRDPSGHFFGRLSGRNWIAAVGMALLTAGWLALIGVVSWQAYWPR